MLTFLEILWSGAEEKTSFVPNEIKRLLHDLLPYMLWHSQYITFTCIFNMPICKNMLSRVLKRKDWTKNKHNEYSLGLKRKNEQRMNILNSQLLLLPYLLLPFFLFLFFVFLYMLQLCISIFSSYGQKYVIGRYFRELNFSKVINFWWE